jgi:hypothetical protein
VSKKFHYVVEVWGGIEPSLIGPYATEDERQAVAKAVHPKQDPDTDATFWLDVTIGEDGKPVTDIGSYSGQFFGDED